MSSLLLFRKRNVPVRNPCFLANPSPDPPKRKVNAGRVSLPSNPNCQRTEHLRVHHPTETRCRTLIQPPKPPCREVSGTASPPPATLPPSMNRLIRSSPAPVNNLLSDFFAAADYFCGSRVDKLAYRPAKAAEISRETGKMFINRHLPRREKFFAGAFKPVWTAETTPFRALRRRQSQPVLCPCAAPWRGYGRAGPPGWHRMRQWDDHVRAPRRPD